MSSTLKKPNKINELEPRARRDLPEFWPKFLKFSQWNQRVTRVSEGHRKSSRAYSSLSHHRATPEKNPLQTDTYLIRSTKGHNGTKYSMPMLHNLPFFTTFFHNLRNYTECNKYSEYWPHDKPNGETFEHGAFHFIFQYHFLHISSSNRQLANSAAPMVSVKINVIISRANHLSFMVLDCYKLIIKTSLGLLPLHTS